MRSPSLCMLVVAAASTACYLNSLDGEFAYDDGAAIVNNLDVTSNETNVFSLLYHMHHTIT